MGEKFYRFVFIVIGLAAYIAWFISVLWIGCSLCNLIGLSFWLLVPCLLALIGIGGYVAVEALGWMFDRLIER